MFIEELKNGKYRVGQRYKDPYTGKCKKVSIVIEKKTRKEIKIAQQILDEKIRTINLKESTYRFGELCDAYQKYQDAHCAPSTATRCKYSLAILRRAIGEDVLCDRLDLRYVRDKIMNSGRSQASIRQMVGRMKTLVKWGCVNGFITSTACVDLLSVGRTPRSEDDEITQRYLEDDELRNLLDAMPEGTKKNLAEFLALTGLRIGEALALEIDDIDTKERLIRVTKTYDSGSHTVYNHTKTDSGKREISIQDQLLPLCKEIRNDALIDRMIYGNNHVFTSKGKIITHVTFNQFLQKYGDEVVGRKVTPHMLRHTHVSLLAAAGLSLDEIARRCGHKDSKVTRDIYFHVTNKLKERDAERIKKVEII